MKFSKNTEEPSHPPPPYWTSHPPLPQTNTLETCQQYSLCGQHFLSFSLAENETEQTQKQAMKRQEVSTRYIYRTDVTGCSVWRTELRKVIKERESCTKEENPMLLRMLSPGLFLLREKSARAWVARAITSGIILQILHIRGLSASFLRFLSFLCSQNIITPSILSPW